MKEILLTGIDVGSTTTKIAAINPENGKVVYSDYRRHQAAQVHSVYDALRRLEKAFPHTKIRLVPHGFRSKTSSQRDCDVPFIQEVVANSHGTTRAVSSCTDRPLSWADRMQK